jgi:hypothetical protein
VTRPGVLPWVLFALWELWLSAAQGVALEVSGLSAWVPDLGLILLLSLSAELERKDLPWLALWFALARASQSVASPASILAASLGLVLVVRGLRTVVELRDLPSRCLLVAASALALERWHALVDARRALAAPGIAPEFLQAAWDAQVGDWPAGAWTRALSTVVFTLLFGPALLHLPGLSPMRRRSTWHVAASARSW